MVPRLRAATMYVSSHRASTYSADNCDGRWPEFGTKFQRKYPHVWI